MEIPMRRQVKYPAEIKASILAKALAPNAPSVVELAKEFNIPPTTIYSWVNHVLKQKNAKQRNTPQRPQDKTAEAKLQAVFDTMDKTETERGAYCRQHGLYTNHLADWKKKILEGLGSVVNAKKHKAEHLLAINEIKQLKQDLHRKDKALAEVSALLILKKKANKSGDYLFGIQLLTIKSFD